MTAGDRERSTVDVESLYGPRSTARWNRVVIVRQRLAGDESPKQTVFVGEMPQTVDGKILTYRLRSVLGAATTPARR